MKPLFPEIRVNGMVIPRARIAAEAQNHPAPPGKPGAAWQAAARALVLRALLLEAARAEGFAEAPAALGDGRKESGEESLLRQYLEAALTPEPVTEAACRAAWAAAPGRSIGAPDLPYAAVAPRLRAALEKAAWARAARELAARLVAEAEIEGIDMAAGGGSRAA